MSYFLESLCKIFSVGFVAMFIAMPVERAVAGIKSVADEIRYEATLPSYGPVGRPLPLAAHWNSGANKRIKGFSPAYQLQMIAQGHYLLPWLRLKSPLEAPGDRYEYQSIIKEIASLKLPISFISTQWESLLSDSPGFYHLDSQNNPNVLGIDGRILKKVSPFGGVNSWVSSGRVWTSRKQVELFQEWYPQPPLVLFVSNNEHSKLQWTALNESLRYRTIYPEGLDDTGKKQVVGNGWIERYRALQTGMREGLINSVWQENSLFVGFQAFEPSAYGRWKDWGEYSLCLPERVSPWPLAWDGASLSYYVSNWNDGSDYVVRSPQVESMNWMPMLEETRKIKAGYWLEISTWDGQQQSPSKDKKTVYRQLGQTYDPERYEGFVQFGMWLLKPRIVREFREGTATLENYERYFQAIMRAVDRVHNSNVLRKFWRRGELVVNRTSKHPYQVNIPKEHRTWDRWYLLETDVNPARPWDLQTPLAVFAIANVLGMAPQREWLVYAHSPLKDYARVTVDVPGYGAMDMPSRRGGIFYHITEKNGLIEQLNVK